MKVSVNGVELCVLCDYRKNAFKHFIKSAELVEDLKRRLVWSIEKESTKAMAQFKQEWDPKFVENGVESVPTDDEKYILLVFEQPNYTPVDTVEGDTTIYVDDEELLTISEARKKMLHPFTKDVVGRGQTVDDWIKYRLRWILNAKFQLAYKHLKDEWDPKLVANGVETIPTAHDEYISLVLSQPNYEDRETRES